MMKWVTITSSGAIHIPAGREQENKYTMYGTVQIKHPGAGFQTLLVAYHATRLKYKVAQQVSEYPLK